MQNIINTQYRNDHLKYRKTGISIADIGDVCLFIYCGYFVIIVLFPAVLLFFNLYLFILSDVVYDWRQIARSYN